MKGKELGGRVFEKFGFYKIKRPEGKLLHIHAASVGESLSIVRLINIILKEGNYNVLVTSQTKTSAEILSKKLPKEVIHSFFPFDIYPFIKRFKKYWQPDLTLFVESELWPGFINLTESDKLFLIGARISDKSFKNWLILQPFARFIINKYKYIYTQSLLDYEKYKVFTNKVKFAGNLKFDNEKLSVNSELVNTLYKSINDKTVICAASTHEGDEAILIKVFKRVKEKNKKLILILAPRHPNRTSKVESLLQKEALNYAIHSKVRGNFKNIDVYLIDTLGELGNFFNLAEITFIGGSFIDIGGHNPIEPSHFNTLIITGPKFHNFINIYNEFIQKQASLIAHDEEELYNIWEDYLNHPAKYDLYKANASNLIKQYNQITENVWQNIKTKTAGFME